MLLRPSTYVRQSQRLWLLVIVMRTVAKLSTAVGMSLAPREVPYNDRHFWNVSAPSALA